MRKAGFAALEAVGLVITALAAPAVINALIGRSNELLWGLFDWAPGGTTGQMIFLGLIALIATASGSWAHLRRGLGVGQDGVGEGPPRSREAA